MLAFSLESVSSKWLLVVLLSVYCHGSLRTNVLCLTSLISSNFVLLDLITVSRLESLRVESISRMKIGLDLDSMEIFLSLTESLVGTISKFWIKFMLFFVDVFKAKDLFLIVSKSDTILDYSPLILA